MSFIKENPSIISKDFEIVGNLKSKGSVEIEGLVKGDIDADSVTIREDGKVNGNIKTNVLNVKGFFNGTVYCEKINISDTAKISGEINYNSLSADYGASINCQLKRTDKNTLKNEYNKNVANSTTTEKLDNKEENNKK